MKKKLVSLLQLAIGLGILGVIFWNLHRTGELGKLVEAVRTARDNWPMLAIGASGFALSVFFCTLRWRCLLETQDVHLPFGRIYTLYLIGQFFSAFMMGATGGDVAKAYYVSQETTHKRTEVVATVFFDRVVGLLALVGLIVVVMLARLPFFLAHRETQIAMVFNILLLAGTIVGLLVIFRRNVLEHWSIFRRLENRPKVHDMITRVYTSVRLCLSHPGVLRKTLWYSFLNHMIMVTWALYIGRALDMPLGFGGMLIVVPLINAIGAIPVTPGGLGTRETAAIFMLGVMGVSTAHAVTFSLLCYGVILLWSLIGGVFYIFYALRQGTVESD